MKPTGKFEHLRVRPPTQFAARSLKTVPWSFVDDREQAFVRQKLGLRVIPAGAKVITGHLKASVTTGRVKGERVAVLASGVQSLLIPIRGGKTPKSPPGTRALGRKAKTVAARARRKNPSPELARWVKQWGYRAQAGTKDRRDLLRRAVTEDGAATVRTMLGELAATLSVAMAMTKRVQADLQWMKREYREERTGAAASKVAANGRRPNPGRLMILNPIPPIVQESLKAMSKADAKRFLTYLSKASPAQRARIVKGLQLYKRQHKVPMSSFELHPGNGFAVMVGVGKAEAVEYHTNKGYRDSAKKGVPFRHRFESGQELVTDENGKKLEIVNRIGARKKTRVDDWIYN